MKLLPKPSDWTGAKCLTSSRPAAWDLDAVIKFKRNHERLRYAADQCAGCTLIGRCASSALADNLAGTIRAGIPLRPRGGGRYAEIDGRARAALHMVTKGEEPITAATKADIKVRL